MTQPMETLAEALPKEMDRVRKVQEHYKEIGPAGIFGIVIIEQDLHAAEIAMANSDVVAMMRALAALRSIKS